MNPLFVPFLTYAIVSVFTPGPSNIAASILGSRVGVRRSLPFIAGMVVGFLAILFASAMLTEFLQANYARFSGYLRWGGVAYLVWLAASLFLPKGQGARVATPEGWGWGSGLLLVLLNPKGILFAVTTFVMFAPLLTGSIALSFGSAAFLSLLLLVSSVLWALTGAALTSALQNNTYLTVFNVIMALLLYAAYSIAVH